MTQHPDNPPDNGRHPSIDRRGQVHGSGAGAGGGQSGEDLDDDAAGGDGPPPTGGDAAPRRHP